MAVTTAADPKPRRVLVLGATGTIGRATVRALLAAGHETVCFIRRPNRTAVTPPRVSQAAVVCALAMSPIPSPCGATVSPESSFDVLVSCLASRTGVPEDAWAIDYHAHAQALAAARECGVRHMVLLSAICVQKPKLAFQHAKLAFETLLMQSGLTYSIVRPTAYFKSLSGQIARVREGKPYLVFGDGRLTSCKPISDDDLGPLPRVLHHHARTARQGASGRRPGRTASRRVEQGNYLHRPAWQGAKVPARSRGHARRDRVAAGPARHPRPAPQGQGRTGADRPLLCHGIDAALGRDGTAL